MRKTKDIIKTDYFDVLLTLQPYGWTDFYFLVDNRNFEYSISHVFSNPFSEIMEALEILIKEEKETFFILYGEPGGCMFEIKTIPSQQHKVIVSLYDFIESCGFEINFNLMMQFEIKMKQLILIFYLQIKKNFLLLNDKEYSSDRNGHDLIQNFPNFEKIVVDYLKKKQMIPSEE